MNTNNKLWLKTKKDPYIAVKALVKPELGSVQEILTLTVRNSRGGGLFMTACGSKLSAG
jgi:hypothetical protein